MLLYVDYVYQDNADIRIRLDIRLILELQLCLYVDCVCI